MSDANGLLQPTIVEHFHEQGNGAAYRALPSLVATDRSQILDTQQRSKAGLCKPGPLADGFESGRGHCTSVPDGANDVANGPVVIIAPIGIAIGPISVPVGGDDLARLDVGNFVTVGHLRSPSAGGALPREAVSEADFEELTLQTAGAGLRRASDDKEIGPLALQVNAFLRASENNFANGEG